MFDYFYHANPGKSRINQIARHTSISSKVIKLITQLQSSQLVQSQSYATYTLEEAAHSYIRLL